MRRYPTSEPCPYRPGYQQQRYRWLPPGERAVAKLHEETNDGGPGLYLVWCPERACQVVIEAYRGWELPLQYRRPIHREVVRPTGDRIHYTLSEMLNPYQYADAQAGWLVAIAELYTLTAPLDSRITKRLRQGDRGSTRYKYGVTPASYREAELRQKVEDPREREADKLVEEISHHMVAGLMDADRVRVPVGLSTEGWKK